MTPIAANEMADLLKKSWMTHDALWFRSCLEACGIEKTNQINRAAIYGAAKIEVKRLARRLGVEQIASFDALGDFIQQATAIIQADFMQFTCEAPRPNVLRWEMHRCFAYEGVSRLGVIDRYQCGIFERLKGWLDGLGVAYAITPEGDDCMMHREGRCFREFHFAFGQANQSSLS